MPILLAATSSPQARSHLNLQQSRSIPAATISPQDDRKDPKETGNARTSRFGGFLCPETGHGGLLAKLGYAQPDKGQSKTLAGFILSPRANNPLGGEDPRGNARSDRARAFIVQSFTSALGCAAPIAPRPSAVPVDLTTSELVMRVTQGQPSRARHPVHQRQFA